MARQGKVAKPNFTGLNAARAYKILDEIIIDGVSLYDTVFKNKAISALDKMTQQEQTEYIALQAKMEAEQNEDNKLEIRNEMITKFSRKFIEFADEGNFEISKALRQNPEKTFELAELYSGTKTDDFLEAVGYAKSYITFLKEVQ